MLHLLNKTYEKNYVEFVAIGLSCHGLCLLQRIGVLKKIKNTGSIHLSDIESYNNTALIRSVFLTLTEAKVTQVKNKHYYLTELGEHLLENIGAIMLPFVGYQKLLSKQFQLVDSPQEWNLGDIDFPEVAAASTQFGKNNFNPALLKTINLLSPKRTICDLGCGSGAKLAEICKATKSQGLGIEQSFDTVKAAKQMLQKNSDLEIIQGDILSLDGIWEEVEIVMTSFVYHDIPTKKTGTFLLSLKKHFPRFRYIIIADIVSPSEDIKSIMPGFDYVHGLQNMSPRHYKATLQTFTDADFRVVQEIYVPNMPNTYIWV